MKILWISSIAWLNNGSYLYPVNGPGAVSGSLFQQNMIGGLEQLGVQVDIITDYPSADRFLTRGEDFTHNNKASDRIISSLKLPIIGHIIKGYTITRAVRSALEHSRYDAIIGYLIHSPYLMGIKQAKEKDKQIQSILICPDLPDMMDMSLEKKIIKRYLKFLDSKLINRLYKSVDKFVLFSKFMSEKIPVGDKPQTVIEGVVSLDNLDFSPVSKEKAVMHAGTLHRNIGIENIIQSMRYLSDDIQLWIFGDGELKEDIIRAAQEDDRIRFMGFIHRHQLFEYQKKASVLINARNPADFFTKYSFPSKTFEYLLSGTPFLTTKLPGIPEEYNQYFHLIDGNDPKVIADGIRVVLDGDQQLLKDKCDDARQFILTQKNNLTQAKKLLEFLRSTKS